MQKPERLIRSTRTGTAAIFMGAVFIFCNFPAAGAVSSSVTEKIQSQILKEERTISVALPIGYEHGNNDFPVLYVLDAESQKEFQREISSVQQLSSEGVIPPLILVGIWNAEGMRNRDMIPVSVGHRPGSGGAYKFLQFIRDELMTHVNNKYRTSDTSFLYGGSNAGLFAVYALLEDSEVFNACIAGSPMIGHCPEYMQKLAEDFVVRGPSKDKLLYMIYGSEDSARVTDFVPQFQLYLERNAPAGFKTYRVILEGDGHVPSSSLERGLRVVFSEEKRNPLFDAALFQADLFICLVNIGF